MWSNIKKNWWDYKKKNTFYTTELGRKWVGTINSYIHDGHVNNGTMPYINIQATSEYNVSTHTAILYVNI